MSTLLFFPYWFVALELATRLALVARVIMRRRPINSMLAWVGLLLFAPFVSQFLYLLIGENRLGSRRLKRYDNVTKNLAVEAIAFWRQSGLAEELTDIESGPIARYGTAVAGIPPLKGNKLDLLPDNLTMLAQLVKDIDAAKDHVHMLYYIWSPHEQVMPVYEAMIRAAKRGVTVRALADGVGSAKFLKHAICKRLKAEGVKVVEALPASIFRIPFERLDLRNHRKIAVIDGLVAYCGSQNINEASYKSKQWRKTGMWVDSTVRVEGPAAQALAMTFIGDWLLDSDEDLTDVKRFLPVPATPATDDSVVQVVPSGPGPTPVAIHQALLTLIYAAREELVMTTPYFAPDESMFSALLAAATRGVQVSLVMPSVSDAPIVAAAARAHYQLLLEAGIKIYEYKGGLLHAKAVTMDRKVGLVGSTNFDHRSFFLNFEVTMFVYDPNFASILRYMQMGYIDKSRQIDLALWRKRPLSARVRDNIAQLMGPLL